MKSVSDYYVATRICYGREMYLEFRNLQVEPVEILENATRWHDPDLLWQALRQLNVPGARVCKVHTEITEVYRCS